MDFKRLSHNERFSMTRRYPNLPEKVLKRDSKICSALIKAWDENHDQYKLMDIFLREAKNLSDERYWELMRSVWILAGSIDNAPLFRELMSSKRRERYYFSTPEDAAKLRSLHDHFLVYRATNNELDGGLSWTLSKGYAERYADMYGKSKIIKREVDKKEVFAYIQRNNEEEIIIL